MPMKQAAESLNLSKTLQHGLTKNAGVTKKEQTVMAAADSQMVERPSYTQRELMPAVEYLRTNAALSKSVGNLQISDEIRELLPALLDELDVKLQPATPKEYAVSMGRLLLFMETFKLPATNQGDLQTIYRDALNDLPADLLNEAVNRIKREHKWNTIPTPAAIRDKVSRQLIDRKLLQIQCRIAARNI